MLYRVLTLLLLVPAIWGLQAPKFRIKYNHKAIHPDFLEQYYPNPNSSYDVLSISSLDSNLVCFLPNLTDPVMLSQLNADVHKAVEKPESQLLLEGLDGILKHLSASECVFTSGLNEDYWTYAYCFGDKVIQFHEDLQEFKRTKIHKPEYPDFVYVLGRFKGSRSEVPEISNQLSEKLVFLDISDFELINDPLAPVSSVSRSTKALKHVLSNGELCDLTLEPRTTEVIYRCNPHMNQKSVIEYIHEVRTCEYRMIVHVRGLCEIEAFAPVSDEKIVDIVCNQVRESKDLVKVTDNFDELVEFGHLSSEGLVFPQPKYVNVDPQEFQLTAAGKGYFWGTPKNMDSSSDLYDHRMVVFYNGEKQDFLKTFPPSFSDSLDRQIMSPLDDVVTWKDMFIMWLEVYDHVGNFWFVVRLQRTQNFDTKEFTVLIVDPFSLMDQDNDLVTIPDMDPSRKMYHFELFSKASQLLKIEDAVFTKYITVTIEEPQSVEKDIQNAEKTSDSDESAKTDNTVVHQDDTLVHDEL